MPHWGHFYGSTPSDLLTDVKNKEATSQSGVREGEMLTKLKPDCLTKMLTNNNVKDR